MDNSTTAEAQSPTEPETETNLGKQAKKTDEAAHAVSTALTSAFTMHVYAVPGILNVYFI